MNKVTKKENTKHKPLTSKKLFPIVAIGASAGGLEAYTTILHNLSTDTGMAFVIIQHSDPNHTSFLNEILQRETEMPVIFTKNNLKPQPNHVYILKPNTVLTFKEGRFIETKRQKLSTVHFPINEFMVSLASDESHYAIGILLSGTNSDGALGLKSIKTKGGITYAQDSKTAKYPYMPNSAIAIGATDTVLPPDSIARDLIKLSSNPFLSIAVNSLPQDPVIEESSNELSKVHELLFDNYGVDFKEYKLATVRRRIIRRMIFNKIDNIKNYVSLLKKNPEEIDALFDDMLINVTNFFRDIEMYAVLKNKILPKILKWKSINSPLRIWVTGGSTGEEAFSLAIIISEYLEKKRIIVPVHIFSTDLSDSVTEKAREGFYSEDIKAHVSKQRLQKYFTFTDGMYRINKEIREMCVFAKHDLIMDPPFSKMDIITCRNVLIYMNQVLQNKLIPIFHYSLVNEGYLILGSAESIGKFSHLFETFDLKNKIFRRKKINGKIPLYFTETDVNDKTFKSLKNDTNYLIENDDISKLADSLILSNYAPAYVVLNNSMDILNFRGKTSNYLEMPQGSATYNLNKLAREGLAYEITELVKKVQRDKMPARKYNVEYNYNDFIKDVNITVLPIKAAGKDNRFLVIFEDSNKEITTIPDKKDILDNNELKQTRKDLSDSQDDLQKAHEKLKSFNEELRAANEEIQSMNEELQSSNEELETSKEELQSSNEELSTVNEELSIRNNELNELNNDLSNLLSSINIPIVMLDISLKIRRYTSSAERIFNLIPTDVGRKITALNLNFNLPDFPKILKEVIETPTTKELNITDNENHCYIMRIRPYLTPGNKITGIIIAFIDVTRLNISLSETEASKKEIIELNKNLEQKVTERTDELEKLNKELKNEILERRTLEDSLRTLSKHLVNAQESVRQRLSRDLHDSINQVLSLVKMKLYSTENMLDKENKKDIKINLKAARELLDNAINEVRNISLNLRPVSLDDLGLKTALNQIIEEFSKRTKIKILFHSAPLKNKLLEDHELHIYRIVQESLHNIEKHSGAKRVKIEMNIKNQNFLMNITDNGKGFKLDKNMYNNISKKKFGLISIKERVESIGGQFRINSLKGKGTELSVSIPILQNGKEKK